MWINSTENEQTGSQGTQSFFCIDYFSAIVHSWNHLHEWGKASLSVGDFT